jgi:hypothetical protein
VKQVDRDATDAPAVTSNTSYRPHLIPKLMNSFPRMLSLVLATIIVFQSGVIAPAVNVSLSADGASIFLRFIWPIFFVLIGAISGVSLLGSLVKWKKRSVIINLITVCCMLTCYLLVPIINAAMDTGNIDLWASLHKVTVGLTSISLILHLIYVFRWHFKDIKG